MNLIILLLSGLNLVMVAKIKMTKMNTQSGCRLFKVILALILLSSTFATNVWAGISTGTGFFVTVDGLFLTCFHVVEDARRIYLKDYEGRDYPAEILSVDRANDLALLKVVGNFSALPIVDSRDVKRGVSVITLGFPHIDIQGFDPKLTDGLVSSLTGIAGDPRVFQITVPIQQGNSGGPLITRESNVIGVISAKLNAISVLKQTGDLAQNVNYAVKSNYAIELIRSIPDIESKLLKARKQPIRDTETLGTLAEKSIALVVVETNRPSPQEDRQEAAEKVKKEDQARREEDGRRLEQERRAYEEQRQKRDELNRLQTQLQVLNQRESDIYRQASTIRQQLTRVDSMSMSLGPAAGGMMYELQVQLTSLQNQLNQVTANKRQVLDRMSQLSR